MFEKEKFTVQLTDPMLYDRLHTLAMEYDLPVERLTANIEQLATGRIKALFGKTADRRLVNVAVNRLLDDVSFVRGLRAGSVEGA